MEGNGSPVRVVQLTHHKDALCLGSLAVPETRPDTGLPQAVSAPQPIREKGEAWSVWLCAEVANAHMLVDEEDSNVLPLRKVLKRGFDHARLSL